MHGAEDIFGPIVTREIGFVVFLLVLGRAEVRAGGLQAVFGFGDCGRFRGASRIGVFSGGENAVGDEELAEGAQMAIEPLFQGRGKVFFEAVDCG